MRHGIEAPWWRPYNPESDFPPESTDMFPKSGRVWLLIFAAISVLPTVGATEPAKWPCQRRCIDAAWIANMGFAYFAEGSQFWRYDIERRKVSFVEVWDNYPMLMRNWRGFPQAWSAGIDTALNGGDGKIYWFKGREY